MDSEEVGSRPLDMMALEDRVFFNAAPLGDVSPDTIDAVNEQIDNVVHMIDMAVDALTVDSDAASWIDETATPADAVQAAAPESGAVPDDDQSALDLPATDPLPAMETYEIVFVDEGVAEYESFVRDIQQRGGGNARYEVIAISSGESGIARISSALSEREGVDAIHFVSHGSEGRVQLGSDWLTADNVDRYAWQIDEWRFSLNADADMLFYGCDLAGSESGRALLESLAASCDCDVAASDDDTGSEKLGGDWDLEFRLGQIETDVAFSRTLQSDWEGVLATFTVTKTQDNTSAGTLRTAINDANASPGPDTIVFAIGSGAQKIQLNGGDLPTITGQVLIDAWTQPGFAGVPLIEIDGKGSAATFQFIGGSDGSTLRGFVVNSSSIAGVTINGTSNVTIEGNWIGTDNTGTVAVPNAQHGIRIQNASNNTIGGLGPNSANVISGNTQHGISTTGGGSSGNTFVGNRIGTDFTGTLDLGNTLNGINLQSAGSSNVIGGSAPGAGNVIAGNNQHGVEIQGGTSGNILRGNFIGTDTSGTLNLGNSGSGVYIPTAATSNTTIGGIGPGEANVIKFNGSDGVTILAGTGHTIRGNSIFANGTVANHLGIDLGLDGVTANDNDDPDAGANDLQNHPIITKSFVSAGGLTISGTIDSTPGATLTLDFYSSSSADTSGYGEGQTYLGSTTVTTSAVNGYASFRRYIVGSFVAGAEITATATTAAGSTSEFNQSRTSTNHTNSLWITTKSDLLLPSGAPGLDYWSSGTAIEIGNPNFTLAPGPTNGTFSRVFNLDDLAADGDAPLKGMHYVTKDITVGTNTTFALLTGDVLFGVEGVETFGGTVVGARDIAVFRPTTPGDYSSGTVSLLLNDFDIDEVYGFSLVERDTFVGDTTLNAGTFIYARKGNASLKGDIFHFEPVDVGVTTTGAISLLIDGFEVSIDVDISGLELIEQVLILGDETLTAGTIVVSGQGSDSVGNNLLPVLKEDIYYLTVTSTNKTPGPAVATATLLLRGLDVGLDSGAEGP